MKSPTPCMEAHCWEPVRTGRVLCERHRIEARTRERRRHRRNGRCECGAAPQAGLTSHGRLWTKCLKCSLKKARRELRRQIKVAKATGPKKALERSVPKHLRYLGTEAALLTWQFEAPRDAAHDQERLKDLKRRVQNSAGSAEFEGPVIVCTRCHQDIAPPGRRRCDSCRGRHRHYMRIYRSAGWRREGENSLNALRRADDVERFRERDREKRLAARIVRERDAEIVRLEAKLKEAVEVMRLFREVEAL